MISLISLIFYLVILGLVFYLLDWLLGQIPLPPPVRVVIRVIMALVLVVILLQFLGVFGPPFLGFPRLER
jgi:hypothetical protein